jgi:hypothetical protein
MEGHMTDPTAQTSSPQTLTRRQVFGAAAGLLGVGAAHTFADAAEASPPPCRDDVAISDVSALLYSPQAPLVPAAGLRDARAVWSGIPMRPDRSALLYLHGFDNYVTVDAAGQSRVPDWAAGDAAAHAGASAKPAAPLAYGLDRLVAQKSGRRPVVLVPEVSTLATGSFWAKEPAGQYADPKRLGLLVSDCLTHLACLHRPDGHPYLSQDFAKPGLERVFVSGHSGAGLILQEAAGSALLQPDTGVPTDLWLFDCTYWSQIAGFVQFCERWHTAGRLGGGRHGTSRLVCVYRPGTQTEAIADTLRGELAGVLGVPSASLVKDHTAANFERDIRPVLPTAATLFLRTFLPHDEIPTFFLPALLQTAAE